MLFLLLKLYGTDGVEYCQFETFNASCSINEIVLVASASYGRVRLNRCATTDYGSLGCSTDVTQLLNSMCSGQRQCNIDVASLRAVVQPCPNDLTSYLDVYFSCVPGITCFYPAICNQHLLHYAAVNCNRYGGYLTTVTFETILQCDSKNLPGGLAAILPKRLEIFQPNFTYMPIMRSCLC